jgi:peptidoglycan/LPS O-acetylase OafA/YrhL
MPAATGDRPGRLAVLDGLRLVAALMVLACHYVWESFDGVHPPQWHLPTATPIAYYGFLGVELFFLISGFVIGMSSWGRGLGEFVTSRISRLFPAFWFGVPAGVSENHRPTVTEVLVNLTMLNKAVGVPSVDAVYWTLFVELRFYLLFAVVVWLGVTYRRVLLFCLLWLTVTVLAPLLDSSVVEAVAQPGFAPYFIAGVAMFLMHRFGPNLLLWALVGICWVLSMHGVTGRVNGHYAGFAVSLWPARVIVTLAFAVVLVVALRWTDRIQWRWLMVAGALTYPLYLLHQRIGTIVIRAGFGAGLPLWAVILGTAVLMLGFAYAVHRLVERPLSRLLRTALRRGLADVRRHSAAGSSSAVGSAAGGSTASGPATGESAAGGEPPLDDARVQVEAERDRSAEDIPAGGLVVRR